MEPATALRHAAGCPACGRRLERERALTAGLRALDAATPGDEPSPAVEAALLAAFVARRPATPARSAVARAQTWRWMAAAAAVVLVVLGTMTLRPWPPAPGRGREAPSPARSRQASGELKVSGSPIQATAPAPRTVPPPQNAHARAIPASVGARPAADAARAGAFVPWPGAAALPGFENGELVRTELPVSVLPLLGLGYAGPRARETVAVDVIVGQDGYARAVRLAEN